MGGQAPRGRNPDNTGARVAIQLVRCVLIRAKAQLLAALKQPTLQAGVHRDDYVLCVRPRHNGDHALSLRPSNRAPCREPTLRHQRWVRGRLSVPPGGLRTLPDRTAAGSGKVTGNGGTPRLGSAAGSGKAAEERGDGERVSTPSLPQGLDSGGLELAEGGRSLARNSSSSAITVSSAGGGGNGVATGRRGLGRAGEWQQWGRQ
ncbi:hypothetical protein HPB47_013957 [Ixodes persulcatus]|uniref:Uncharacterized protein n=1 Tax=Ixodes persulcatus TaxID=34615 RepID=A0AC60QYK2_IXOPE|nr:hypothetical protein HPB47_013957 [Ixodes persulcatus]